MNALRVLLQLAYSSILTAYFGSFLFSGPDWRTIPWLLLSLIWLIGCFCSAIDKRMANWIILIGSFMPLAAGTLFHILRISFIIKNGGMDNPHGMGSPLAFIMGWTFTTLAFFIPGLVFFLWNLYSLKTKTAEQGAAANP